jgi:hypothetical protein
MNTYLGRWTALAFGKFTKTINDGEEMSREDFNEFMDSSRKGQTVIFGEKYKSRQEYDSLTKAGKNKGWVDHENDKEQGF